MITMEELESFSYDDYTGVLQIGKRDAVHFVESITGDEYRVHISSIDLTDFLWKTVRINAFISGDNIFIHKVSVI